MTNKAKITYCASFEEAINKTMQDAVFCNGTVLPVILGHQGHRTVISGALSMQLLEKHVHRDSAKKSDSPDALIDRRNRPLIEEHADAIAKYLISNAGATANGKGTYILPPLTLSLEEELSLYIVGGSKGPTSFGLAVIPASAKIAITDGQHRKEGTERARDGMRPSDRDAFDTDSITFMLTLEDNIEQAQQDFADCSKTKPIPASMLTVYDRRPPANKIVLKLTEQCKVFKNKIDSTSKQLTAKSTNLFLANQVRQLVKSLTTGDPALAEGQFMERLARTIPSNEELDSVVKLCVEFIDELTLHLPAWQQASQIIDLGAGMNQIPSLRTKVPSVAYTATGLNIIGCIGFELLFDQDTAQYRTNWKSYVSALGSRIDWRKSNTVFWKDILVAKLGKPDKETGKAATVYNITTQRGAVARAVAKVRVAIGLDPEPPRQENLLPASP